MIEVLASDAELWRNGFTLLTFLMFGTLLVSFGGTADMTDGEGCRIGFPFSNFAYWRYVGAIFGREFYRRQKPSRRWAIYLARLTFWMQFVWIAAAVWLAFFLEVPAL